jgi:hypothetical protein
MKNAIRQRSDARAYDWHVGDGSMHKESTLLRAMAPYARSADTYSLLCSPLSALSALCAPHRCGQRLDRTEIAVSYAEYANLIRRTPLARTTMPTHATTMPP